MKLLKAASVPVLSLGLFLSACKKEGNEANQGECKILKTESYEANTVSYRGIYTYTDNNITKVEVPELGGYYTLEYTDSKIAKRRYYENGSSVIDMYDQISYNTDGSIAKIETYELVNPGATYERYDVTAFTYTNGKLSKLQIFEDWGGSLELSEEYTYTFTGNNITAVAYKDWESGQTRNLTFQYNSESNFYQKQNSQILLADPFLSSVDGMFPLLAGDLLPLVLSANNMTSIREGNSTPTSIEYEKDEKGNITALLIDGEKTYGYAYECK